MKQLKEYCMKICYINGIKTYIISPQYYEEIVADADLLASLFIAPNKIMPYIKIAENSGDLELLFAFTQHENRKERFTWMPVNCYKDRNAFYHVYVRNSWMCRECGHMRYGTVIMPIIEHEPIFYSAADNRYPPIPKIFKKELCEECGRLLQNHLIFVNQD